MRNRYYTLFAGAAGAALVLGASAAAAQAAGSSTTLQEVVVSSQKRNQSLQSVPISVTAVTAQSLVANRIATVADLNALAPNLSVHTSAGGVGIPAITLRGVLTYGVVPGTDREVSMYIDGVYIGTAQGAIFDLADLNRIEVLKGPQGTLFGRNATGGAISLVTRNPTGQLGIHEELTGGNYDQFRTKTRVDLPRTGPFSATVTYVHDQRRGDIKNLGGGTVWHLPNGTYTSPEWLGSHNISAVSAAIKFEPSDNFNLIYKFDWSEDHNTPEGVSPTFISSAFQPVIGAQPNPGNLSQVTLTRPSAVNNAFTSPGYVRTYGHNFTAQFRLADNLTLKNILALRGTYTQAAYELDGEGGLTLGVPFALALDDSSASEDQFSDELVLNYESHWLTGTAGAVHFHSNAIAGTFGNASDELGALFGPTYEVLPGHIVPVEPGFTPDHSTEESDAVYGQAEIHVLPVFDVVGGYRYTQDSKTETFKIPTIAATSSPDYKGGRSSYSISLDYKPFDRTLVYLKYATAYMSGGYSYGNPYQAETASSYEGGVKAEFLDRRLRTDLAVFTVTYDNLQSATGGSLVAPQFDGIGAIQVNFGDARAQGFEFEGSALPLKNLTLNAGVGYTDFKYLTFDRDATDGAPYLLPGFRPRWTADFSGQYDTPPVIGQSGLNLRVDANYRSQEYISSFPTSFVNEALGGLTAAQLKQVAASSISPGAWQVNARATLANLPVPKGRASVALWVKNLTDDKSIDFSDSFVALSSASFEHARTFGVDLNYDF